MYQTGYCFFLFMVALSIFTSTVDLIQNIIETNNGCISFAEGILMYGQPKTFLGLECKKGGF